MVIEKSVAILANITKVWDTFIDLTCWIDWNTVLKDAKCEGDTCIMEGKSFSCRFEPYSIPMTFTATIEEVIPHKKVVWTTRKLGIFAHHEFTFETTDDHVKVTSREILSGLPVMAPKLFFPKSEMIAMTQKLLWDLKEAAEA
jgi:hypothetical protein